MVFRQPPPELLHLIFERTILPLSLLDPTAGVACDSIWCQVFRQKQALVSVCKAWYSVGIPFLYEHIQIRFIPQLSRLLDTLQNTGTCFKKFINSISFYCTIPVPYADRFEDKLRLFFSLCPNATYFSYLSPCPLPSQTCLRVLPMHVTRLQLDIDVSYEILLSTLEIVSPNLILLSFICPKVDPSNGIRGADSLELPNLKALSLGFSHDYTFIGEVFSTSHIEFNMPRIKMLTFRPPRGDPLRHAIASICHKYGARLQYLHIAPAYIWPHRRAEFYLTGILDLCPALKQMVIPFYSDISNAMHPHIKWVDVWEPYSSKYWTNTWVTDRQGIFENTQNLYKQINTTNFPSLQGVRKISACLAYLTDIPIILPPGRVLTPLDSYAFDFSGLMIRHDVGRIYGDGQPRPPISAVKGYSFSPCSYTHDDSESTDEEDCDDGDSTSDEDSTDDDDPRIDHSENGDNVESDDSEDSSSIGSDDIDRRYRWRWRSESVSSSEISDSADSIDWEVLPGQDDVVILDAQMDALE